MRYSKAMIEETVYIGRDNTIDLLLKADDVAQDLSGVTKMVLIDDSDKADAVDDISSEDHSAAFDWSSAVTGKLILSLGEVFESEEIDRGRYVFNLVVFDPANTDGIVWDKIFITAR
jgi:hypothetical protein